MSMIRHLTTLSLAAVVCVAVAAPASAQRRPQSEATARVTAPLEAKLRGTGQDDRGEPLSGAVVSALGSSPVFAIDFRTRNLGGRAPGVTDAQYLQPRPADAPAGRRRQDERDSWRLGCQMAGSEARRPSTRLVP